MADFYARIGESERSLKVLAAPRADRRSGDPAHLVDLGDHYFQDGNTPLAVQTWKRILVVVQPRAQGARRARRRVPRARHDRRRARAPTSEAVALDPDNLAFKKALAAALERTRDYREARALYRRSPRRRADKGDKVLAREAGRAS